MVTFDTDFDYECVKPVILSTRAEAKETHWHQTLRK
jgi:hypothetical protein